MLAKLLILIALSAAATVVWAVALRYPLPYADQVSYSLVAVAVSYLFLKVLLEGIVGSRIKEARARYSFRKATQLLFLIASFVIVLRVWIPNPQALLVAYGLVAAGVAIALQDVFKNLAGALSILISGIYRVGDRVQIGGKLGDVIDIGPFYTTLIELGEWVDGDQTTGRLVFLPNGHVLSSPVHNYTKDHDFLWDEIGLPITHDSDWRNAVQIVQDIVSTKTADTTTQAERDISRLEEKYYVSKRNIEPAVFITPTDNWIMLRVRYVVDVRDRRLVRNQISELVLDALRQTAGVTIASQTLTVTMPPPAAAGNGLQTRDGQPDGERS